MKKLLLLVLAICCSSLQATTINMANKSGAARTVYANGTYGSCEGIAAGVFTFGAGLIGAAAAENDIDNGKIQPSWDGRPITVQDNQAATVCRVKSTPLQVWTNDPEITFLGRDGIRRDRLEIPIGQVWHVDIVRK